MTDFFMDWPFMTPAYKEEQIKGYLPFLSLEVINAFLKSISYDKNVVVLYQAPEGRPRASRRTGFHNHNRQSEEC